MDATAIMSSLAETIRIAIEARTGPGGTSQLKHVVELANPQWAPTDHGIEHLGPRRTRSRDASYRTKPAATPSARSPGFPEADDFEQAWDLGQAYHRHGDSTRGPGLVPLNRHRAPLEPTSRDPTASERRG